MTWRWAFWINLPVSIVVICVASAAIPALTSTAKPVVDYAGIAFIGLGAAGLTLATSWGGTVYPWQSATIIGLFAASTLALAVFVWVEIRAAQPILPIRLFANPVFTVCCVLSFVVGFAMLGAMTFLPTFMQYVNGVSATTSGLRTLPMVVGMLVTSTGSGTLVGRTGRYKIFPVAGTALMTIAFVLMSRMDGSTPAALQSVYLLTLGAGIGLSMQVLVLIVQNTSNFGDLGVATSGVSFFRTIGSSFGAAVFGSLFVNFLNRRLGPALATSGVSAEAASSPGALHRQPAAVIAPIVHAYAESLSQVFLCAAPVAAVGFVLALFLREVPLRDIHPSTVDLGDGFAMPTTETPEQMLENAIARVLRAEPGMRLRSIAMRPDCRLDVAGLWAVLRVNRYQQFFGVARLTDMGEHLNIPFELLEPTFARLAAAGYLIRDGDRVRLTPAGVAQVDYVYSLLVAWLTDKLSRSAGFAARPDREAVQAALGRVAYRVIAQRDWNDETPTVAMSGAGAHTGS